MDKKMSLCIISCLLMIIGIGVCFAVAIFGQEDDIVSKPPKVEEKIEYDGTIIYNIGCDYKNVILKDLINLEEKEVKEIYSEYKKYTFKKLDEKNVFEDFYIITIDDIVISLEPNSTNAFIDDEYYNIGDFYKYLTDFLSNKIDDNTLYLYNYNTLSEKDSLYSINLSEDINEQLLVLVDNINYNVSNSDTIIWGNYLLIINDLYIYFDSFDGLAMINGKYVELPLEMVNILEKKLAFKSDECCSCCPDLKPGEACIQMCCPCSD